MKKQRVLRFCDNRRIELVTLPVEQGCAISAKTGEAWDVEPRFLVPFGRDLVVVVTEHNAEPLDLSSPTLTANGLTEDKLRAIGIESFNQALIKVVRRPTVPPLRLLWGISLLFALGTVLMVILGLWEAGKLRWPF